MGGCATKENKENKPAEDSDGCVLYQTGGGVAVARGVALCV